MLNLDSARAELHDWCESLYVEDNSGGAYRMGSTGRVNLLSTTDIAWLRYAICDLEDLEATRRQEWVRWMQGEQSTEDGHYEYTDAVGPGNMHSNGHAFWHVSRALGILDAEIIRFPEYLQEAMTTAGLEKWFSQWESTSNPTHHDVLGLIPILANTADAGWVDHFYAELARQQDPERGTWPRDRKANISRTFAYSAVFRATGRIPPQPEKIINAILSLQGADGFWREGNHSFFSTMDAIYILVRMPRLRGFKTREAIAALRKIERPVIDLYRSPDENLTKNTHSMLSVVHSIGLLAEAFPEDFPRSMAWRFDWDKPELFHCDLLRRRLISTA